VRGRHTPLVVRVSKWGTLVAVCAATFMLLIDITIVNVALPSIQRSLDASFTDVAWVVDAYTLTLAATMLTAGSTADLIGRRRVFATGVAVFTVASLLCAVATGPLFLILARALQGVGGAQMFATSLALIAGAFQGRERGTAFGVWGASIGAAVAIGPLVGGALTEGLSWRWIFLVNLPVGVLTIVLTFLWIAESRDPAGRRVDWPGLATFSAAMFSLVLGLLRGNDEGWSSTFILGLFAAAAVLFGAFIAVEARRALPMVDLRLFRRPGFLGAQLTSFAIGGGFFSMFLFLALYLQNELGYSPLQAGLRFLPITLVIFAVSPVVGRLAHAVPARVFLGGGLVLIGCGLILMSGLDDDSRWTALLAGFVVAGLGTGFVNPTLAGVAVGVVPPQQSGMASGMNATFRFVGITTGIAALGALLQHHVSSSAEAAAPSGRIDEVTQQIASGNADRALASVSPALRTAADHAFVTGLNQLFVVGAIVTIVGGLLAFALVRARDLGQQGPRSQPQPAPAEPG
jgi:EmrB/QacA subfamily drug resistance transporter